MEGWKETEVGMTPENWNILMFPKFVVLQRGKDLTKVNFKTGNVPVAGSSGIIGYHDTSFVKGPGVTVGRSGSCGQVRYYEIDFWAHNTALYIKDFNGNDELFSYFYLLYLDVGRYKTGVSVPTLDRNSLNNIKIPLPPLPEQRKIAHVLTTVQKAIEQQDTLIRTTTELKKALMQKLFTEGTRGEAQKETEIGRVPGSWDVKPFSEIFEIIKNQSHSRDKLTFEKTETEVLNIHYGDIHAKFKGNIVDLELEEVPYIIDEYVDEIKNNYLRDGDIVIADASEDLIDIGKCIELKNVKNRKIIGGLHTIIARNKINLIQKGFGAYIFKNKYVSTELRFIANGLSVYGISKGNILKMLIPIPPAKEQVEIGKTMDRCNKKIFFHQKKKQTLTALFKTLLHELMTGQRRVHELEFEDIQSKTLEQKYR